MKKNILLCFIDDIKNSNEFDKFISKFEDRGVEVHLLNGVVENNIQPHDIIHIIETIFTDELENYNYYFLTNIEDFFILVYRIYHQFFHQFIFFVDSHINYNVNLENIYKEILKNDVHPNENIVKPIFINENTYRELNNELIGRLCVPLIDVEDLFKTESINIVQKYYYFNNSYFLFEPVNGEDIIISFEENENREEISYFNTKICYQTLPIHEAIQLISELAKSKNNFVHSYQHIQKYFDYLRSAILSSGYFTKNFYVKAFELLSRSFDVYVEVFILSFLISIVPDSKYYNRIYSILIGNHQIGRDEKYFYLYQCIRLGFVNSGLGDSETAILQRKLYRDIYNSFKKEIDGRYKFIPKEDRDENFIIVLTGQFLGLNHAPTKTALDRCYSLIKHLGKKVMLINTKELLTAKGLSPFYNLVTGNQVKEFEKIRYIKYKDIEIPFYQTPFQMPHMEEIIRIIEVINHLKPYFIINIGGGSITADLCSQIVPVATISTVFSGLPLSEGQMYVIGRKINENDVKLLNEFGFSEENVIESVFTFDFKPQQNKFTRSQFNLPENKFLIAVVGARLDEEITDTFIETLLETTNLGVHIVFIGCFTKYNSYGAKHKKLKDNSTYLGFQDDVLAVLELCDLYVNPKRIGGGSSAAEAMFKGLPVVTLKTGDVAVASGSDFWVNSYDEMKQTIEKYVKDKEFYHQMSKKAKQRAEILLSTHEQMKEIVCKIENNKFFG
jgi:glycosyltransferase involved in cell wall biosynthesis